MQNDYFHEAMAEKQLNWVFFLEEVVAYCNVQVRGAFIEKVWNFLFYGMRQLFGSSFTFSNES